MSNYQNMIENASNDIIQDGKLVYHDTILIGDNSSGKSDLLRAIVEKSVERKDNVYYLDAVNRSFSVKDVDFIKRELKYTQNIIVTRKDDVYFNLKDSFNIFRTSVEGIECIYSSYEEPLKQLMKEFLGIDIDIKKDIEKVFLVNQEECNMSSGIQALVRIFLEVLYYYNTSTVQEEGSKNILIIDEIDEYLSPANSYKLLPFLKKKFPEIQLVVTTHSSEVISGASEFNIIIIKENHYECLDSNDFDSIIEINALFNKTFCYSDDKEKEQERSNKKQIDDELRRLFNNRISGELNKQDEEVLEKLKLKQLTKAQSVLLRQIEEW